MRFSTAVSFALIALLLVSVPGTVTATPSPSPPATDGSPAVHTQSQLLSTGADAPVPAIGTQQSMPEAAEPEQVIRLNVTSSGDVEWTVESRFLLTEDDDVEAFHDYAADVRSGERDAVYDRSLFEPHVRAAQESTDREMAIENAGWDEPRLESPEDAAGDTDDLEDETQIGVLAYSFTWTNFATADESRVYFGDAFQTADGLWFSALVDGQRLVIQSPPNSAFDDYNLPLSPEDGALVLDGPYQFSEGELEVVFLRGAGPGPGPSDGGLSSLLLGGIALLVLIVGATSFVLARRSPEPRVSVAQLRDRLPWIDAGADTETASDIDDPSAGAAALSAIETQSEGSDPSDRPQEFAYTEDAANDVDPELLSDEERVLRLLRRNSGRMKQASIVKETGWSNAKVSQLLSKMDDNEEIDKLRIGRENLITLPEIDPTELD